ncbi:MAG: amidohydrolase family protein [Acidobacteriota bacterium]|nr:MAG: amidohydrolase family protein [Acidobacteriota bacterium]
MFTKASAFLASILILLVSSVMTQSPAQENDLLIRDVTVLDPSSEPIKPFKASVLIRRGRIEFVGSKSGLKGANAARVIDGRGRYLIPGLIDSHTHLANVAGLNWGLAKRHSDLVREYRRQLPGSYLYFGYTTLIDVNVHSPEVLELLRKEPIRPEILTCGQQLEVWNGFMMAETPPEERLSEFPGFLHDRFNTKAILPKGLDPRGHTPAAVVRHVTEIQGGQCLKLAHENGFGGTDDVTWEMPSSEIVSEVASEAEKAGVPLMLHASSFESQKFALETGVDIIAHGMWHWGDLLEFLKVTELPAGHRQLLEEIALKKIGYQPTFRVIAGQRDVFVDDFLANPALQYVYPKKMLAWLSTEEGRWQERNIKRYAKGFFDGKSNAEIAAFMQLMVDKIGVSAKVIADNNGVLLFGTDTPASNAHTNPPGLNGYLEMREWQKAGIGLEALLKAATISNARAFGLESEIGGVRPGMRADLLLLRKDPLKDVSAYDSIEIVIMDGRAIERSEFSAAK